MRTREIDFDVILAKRFQQTGHLSRGHKSNDLTRIKWRRQKHAEEEEGEE